MEEKERYVIRYDLDYNRCLIDTEENQGVGDYIQIVILLNQQDKRIKELEAKVLTPFMKTLQEKKWGASSEENRKLTEELDKYKETVQELQGTSSKMFDKLLENHLSKFQENPYCNEENEEFKNDIKLLIQVAKQIKDFKNSQNQVAIKELEKLKDDLLENFGQSSPLANRVDLVVKINEQIENLKG